MLEIKSKISILVYHTEKEGAISRFFSVKKARSSLRKRLFALLSIRYNDVRMLRRAAKRKRTEMKGWLQCLPILKLRSRQN